MHVRTDVVAVAFWALLQPGLLGARSVSPAADGSTPGPGNAPAPAPGEVAVPASSAGSTGVEQAGKSILVLNVRPIGVPDSDMAALTELIAENLGQMPGLRVLTIADIKETLAHEGNKQLLGCESDEACLARLGSMAHVDLLLSSSLGKVGEELVLNLSLIESATSQTRERSTHTCKSLGELPAALPDLLAGLMGTNVGTAGPRFKLAAGQAMSFAVFDLRPTGVDAVTADNLTQILSVELKKVEGSSVVSRDDIKAMLQLEEQKAMLASCEETSCIAEIGGALGVDRIVVGSVGKLADSYVISLRLINPQQATVESRVTESFRGVEDQLIRAVRHAGRKLLGVGEGATGSLAVSCALAEAEVLVDNEAVGTLPMKTLEKVAAGHHVLKVAKAGFYEWQSDVYVDPSETTAIWVELTEIPERWYQKWWVWTIVGVGGVALVSGAGAAIYYGLAGQSSATMEVTAARPGGAL
ncbi:MAG: PEGA domain-containing protein [Pseudomonadota bacterium]